MGCIREAADILNEAVTATGGDVSVLTNLAILLERLGRHAESISIAERVIATDPDHEAARLTLGLALLRGGHPGKAVHHYRLLTANLPGNPDAFLNLGEALMAIDQYSEALTAYERAIELKPALIAALIGKGQALAMLERFNESDAIFSEATRLDSGETAGCFLRMAKSTGQRIPPGWRAQAVEVFLSRRWAQQQVCDWRFRDAYLDELQCYARQLAATGAGAHDPSLAFQCLAAPLPVRERRSLLDGVAAGIAASAGPPARRRLTRLAGPIRLGFISADFRESPTAQVHWRQLALHDRTRFQVHAYSLVDAGNSPLRRRIIESVDHFHDVSRASATEAAWRIARDGIDILVDLTGLVDNARPEILALRPAPLRVSYMGGLVPLGKRLVDYRLSDRTTTPDNGEFTEALALLPDTHFIYNDEEPINDRSPTRRECGLPDEGFVFCAFNSCFKIEPTVFDIWMELLKSLPGSVLWLRDEGSATIHNLRGAAVARGIADDRLIFAPRMGRPSHLARHARADLFLDTLICNAGTTAADALWAGLPVLTCTGNTMASRLATSLVSAAGLQDLIVSSTDEYRSLAYRLATTPTLLHGLRQRLAEDRGTSPLFATRRRVRHIERSFEMMWERHTAGLPPASFDVPDDAPRSQETKA